MKTTVKKWGINGEGIAFHEGKPVFIENAIPDEVIEFDIKSDEGTYLVGELTRLVEQSSKRRYPLCPIWKECGGCALMHVKYPAQCKMKEGNLKETLIKYADYNGRILPIIKNPEPLSYRNSCKLPFGEEYGELYTGMYERDTNHFQKMERCYVHSKLLEQTRQEVLKIMNEHHLKMYDDKKKTGYRTLVMKEFDSKIQIIFVTGKEDISEEFIHDVTQLEGVVSIWQSVKTETKREVFGDMRFIWGEEKMHLQLEDIQLSLLPRSFFQLNTKQSVNLYNVVKDWMPRSKTTVEAYSGIGAISLFVKDKAEEIVGVESIQDAVDNANENAMLNHADNVSFICEDAGSALAHLVQEKEVDTLIVDPPRSGLDDIMKETILKSKIKTMIYVSCNPATLAKDLGVLKKEYRIVKIQPVDMFSQTPHVESVTLLVRNDDYKPRRRFDDRKIVTINQEEMEISNLDVVLMIEKTVTISQDADSMMINQDVVLMMISQEEMVTISQDVDLMMIVDQNVLQMTNQIVDMVNKTCKDFRQIKLKSFSYLLEIYFRESWHFNDESFKYGWQ